MKKLDRILNNLEKAISAIVITLFGMISYAFVNADTLSTTRITILWIGVVSACGVIAVLCVVYMKYLNQLKED